MSESPVLFQARLFHVTREILCTADGREHVREIVRHPGAVAIVPVLDDGRICLIENYRIAVDRVLLELPAGTREPDEPPAETALRELAEETGYRAGSIRELTALLMSPGILDEKIHIYLATALAPGAAALEAGEQITVRPIEWSEAVEMIRDGRIQDAKTVAGLLHYGAFVRKYIKAAL